MNRQTTIERGQAVFLRNLRAVRVKRFVTQDELSERAGVGVVTISRLESGLQEARISTVRKLAAALGVEPGELVGEDDKGAR